MIRIASIILLISLSFPALFFGQGETTNWYFGNGAGITFNNDGTVTPLTDGNLDTFEGCATISDSFGNLLFYTDGILVYNGDHELMENGAGLQGDTSSTQSALIVPKPGDTDIYFIFTVDTKAFNEDPDTGLNYSIVDMSLNNKKGAVTQKNIPLLADCSEKIAAVVKDCSDQSIWLVTFASEEGNKPIFNTFHAFQISASGVQSNAVKTTFTDLTIEDPRGYLKISPDGTKLANANMQDGTYIYDFDAKTGQLSNQEKIELPEPNKAAYGVEFSPNGQFLYVHASNDALGESGHRSSLLQYDLFSSDIEIIQTSSMYRGALQLGENGKIYRTNAESYFKGTPFLSVIHNPNQKGSAANYEHEGIALNGRNSTQGLPPFIQSFFDKVDLVKNLDGTKSSSVAVCEGDAIALEAELIPGASYLWEKDGIAITNSEYNLNIPFSSVLDAGKYRLTITTPNPDECPIIGEASVEVVQLPESNFLTIEQCDVDADNTDGVSVIDLTNGISEKELEFTFYETLADQNNNNPIKTPESYSNAQAFSQNIYYDVTNKLGCSTSGQIELIVNPTTITESVASPFISCDESTFDTVLEATFDLNLLEQSFAKYEVAFYENLDDVIREENPLMGNLKTANTTIYARIENENQCMGIESIELLVNPIPEVSLADTYQVCSDGKPLVIEAPDGFDTYTWYKIGTSKNEIIGSTSQLTIVDGGSFRLEIGTTFDVNNQVFQCTGSSDFLVNASNRATFEEISVQDLSTNNSIVAQVSGDGEYEFSLDGQDYQTSARFDNLEPGFYTVFARDLRGCGISEQEVSVIGFPRFFTPNGDGYNDTWQLIGSNQGMIEGKIDIYDRYGRLLRQIDSENQSWDGSSNGEILPASDYWFRISLVNGKEFKGHFTLKR